MAANNNAISPSQNIPRFAGINYQFWRVKMKTLFVSCDLWELVENGFVDLADSEEVPRLTVAQRNELKEKKKKDAKALFMIQQALDEAIFPRVIGATTSKEAWDLLQDEYQGSSRMKAFDTIQDFFTKVSSLVNEIRSLGEDLIEQKIVEKVLRSLPPGFDHVVAAIEESKDLPEYSLIELMGSLQAHEQRLNRSADTSMEHAFQTKVNQKKKRVEDSGRGSNGGGPRYGNPTRGRGHGRSNGQQKYFNGGNEDRGCSNHMTENRNFFVEIVEAVKSQVKMGDNNKVFSDVVVNGFGASTDDSMIWHRRFCHLNFVGLYLLQRMNMVAGLSMVKDDHSKLTANYTPQQNGMVEHKNKTIVETAKSMMKDKGLPKEFWVEAVAVVVYVLNRFLTCSVKGKTPYEAWSGRKPNENNGREMPIIIVDESSNLETISPHESPSTTTDTLSSSSIDSTPRRVRNLADIYASCEFACFAMEPTCFEDAVDKEEWVIAMKKELAATEKNNTWSLVDLPIGKEAIDLKWIYRSKFNPDRTLQKNKA
ncbi:uncharacterized protein [Elaeis guineensis]|uniref:uncharacterized protein n=1 Tax=Elaeis guineensis var. tenera TaxID=51953 RepID=UPI003C6CF1EE